MQQAMKPINTIDDLIEAFGGASELGRQLGITQEAISMWRVRGEIPPGWHYKLFVEGRLVGLDVDPSVFGYEAESADRVRSALSPAAA